MRFLAVALLMICTWYLAGMYHNVAMMTVLITGAVLLLMMSVFVYYMAHNINTDFSDRNAISRKNTDTKCYIRIKNKGHLPINRFCIKLGFHYADNKKTTVYKKLYGNIIKNNEDIFEFNFKAPYCGMIVAKIKNIRIYDYVSLFSTKKKIDSFAEIFVLPSERSLKISFSASNLYDAEPITEEISKQAGDNHSEIRQLREYQNGDSNKNIHWNYTARTDDIWIKEYEKENDVRFNCLIDTSVDNTYPDIEQQDRFYELISAVILGFIEQEAILNVYWYDTDKKTLNSFEVKNKRQCEEFFSKLYHTDIWCSKSEFLSNTAHIVDKCVKVNTNLELYKGNDMVYRFSNKNFDNEIESIVFSI